jgi:hypothetical protein
MAAEILSELGQRSTSRGGRRGDDKVQSEAHPLAHPTHATRSCIHALLVFFLQPPSTTRLQWLLNSLDVRVFNFHVRVELGAPPEGGTCDAVGMTVPSITLCNAPREKVRSPSFTLV